MTGRGSLRSGHQDINYVWASAAAKTTDDTESVSFLEDKGVIDSSINEIGTELLVIGI